jgi:hypothetical protein
VNSSAFQLSRIYSQGWNAAKKFLADGALDADVKAAVALNPYRTAEESVRWAQGFTEALESVAVPFNSPGRKPWGPPEPD